MTAAELDLLRRIDAYLDAAPRTAARAETIGPFTLFVNEGTGWRYYARPTPGTTAFTAGDVEVVRARQRELRMPESFEWIADLVPDLAEAVRDAGMTVTEHPAMMLRPPAFLPVPAPDGVTIGAATPAGDLAVVQAVAMVSFRAPGTARGEAGPDAVRVAAASVPPGMVAFARDRIERELTITAVAVADDAPVAVGSHQPLDGVSEIAGVGTLPAYRRRGIGTAVTSFLVRDARSRGVRTIFLTAGDEEIARVYERVGFDRVGTACAAEPRRDGGRRG